VLLYFNEPLMTSLSSSTGSKPPAKSRKTTIDPTNLQLVMDVELNVSLRFGQCQLPLRDVLDLASGSVIELDRDVDDLVELLLDGKVIARGEAVIVDGNYGLRVTEIPEPIASHFAR
jgi:flagellar motor switch protein FliN/FliY